jgi:hypothetical protein
MTDGRGHFGYCPLRRQLRGRSSQKAAMSAKVEGAMKARKIIQESAYGPETIKFMSETLELAWAKIAPTFGEDREAKDAARQTLARIQLAMIHPTSRNLPNWRWKPWLSVREGAWRSVWVLPGRVSVQEMTCRAAPLLFFSSIRVGLVSLRPRRALCAHA